MGLDMYLFKSKKIDSLEVWKGKVLTNLELWELDPDILKKKQKRLYKKLVPYLIAEKLSYKTYADEIGYWRKANQIHHWFVENVQDGKDDCNYYLVSKDNLEKLYNLFLKTRACFDVDGKPIPKLENSIEDYLPSQGGFFFGSTEYDDYDDEDKSMYECTEKFVGDNLTRIKVCLLKMNNS